MATTDNFNGMTIIGFNTDYQAMVAKILGQGAIDYGYGQQVTSTPVTDKTLISAAHWLNLRNDIVRIRAHQTGDVLAQEQLPYISANSLISANTIKNATNSYSYWIKQIETDRGMIASSQASRSNLISASVDTGTGLNHGWNGKVTNTVTIQFRDDAGQPTASATRRYFNTGGAIEFSASRLGGTSHAKNAAWSDMLSAMGTISFKLYETTTKRDNGSIGEGTLLHAPGTTSSVGFKYLLTRPASDTSDVAIYEQSGAAYGYGGNPTAVPPIPPNSYRIYANLDDTKSLLTFKIEFDDSDISIPNDQGSEYNVDGILTSTVRSYRATGNYVSVPLPDSNSVFPIGNAVPFVEKTQPTAAVTPTYTVTIAGGNRIQYGTDPNVRTITIDEGISSSDIIITVTTTNLYSPASSPVLLPWRIVGTGTNPVDTYDITPLSENALPLAGTIAIVNGVGTLRINALADKKTEGTETFVVQITQVDKNIISTETIAIRDLSVEPDKLPVTKLVTGGYSLDQSAVEIDVSTPNRYVNFNVTVPSDFTGTKLYWKTVGGAGITGADFEKDPNAHTQDGLVGYVSIDTTTLVNGSYVGTFTRTAINDFDQDENFSINIFKLQNDVTPLLTSMPIKIIGRAVAPGVPNFSVEQSAVQVTGGSEVTFTVHTPTSFVGDRLYWRVVGSDGINSADFFKVSSSATDAEKAVYGYSTDGLVGRVMIDSSKSGTFKVKTIADTDPDEQFTIEFTVNQSDTAAVVTSLPVTILGSVPGSYGLTQSATEIRPGQIVDFTVTVPSSFTGTTLWWKTVKGPGITGADFVIETTGGNVATYGNSSDGLTGSISIDNTKTAKLTRKIASDFDEDEKFAITFHETQQGPAVQTSSAITIIGTPQVIVSVGDYSINTDWTQIAEGSPVKVTINTPTDVADGTLLRWKISGDDTITPSDFTFNPSEVTVNSSGLEGTIKIQNKKAEFSITPRADGITEGPEYFNVMVYDTSNQLVLTSQQITIIDTSTDSNYTVTSSIISLAGQTYTSSFVIKVNTSGVPAGTVLHANISGTAKFAPVTTSIRDYSYDETGSTGFTAYNESTERITFTTTSSSIIQFRYNVNVQILKTIDPNKIVVWELFDNLNNSLGSQILTIKSPKYLLEITPVDEVGVSQSNSSMYLNETAPYLDASDPTSTTKNSTNRFALTLTAVDGYANMTMRLGRGSQSSANGLLTPTRFLTSADRLIDRYFTDPLTNIKYSKDFMLIIPEKDPTDPTDTTVYIPADNIVNITNSSVTWMFEILADQYTDGPKLVQFSLVGNGLPSTFAALTSNAVGIADTSLTPPSNGKAIAWTNVVTGTNNIMPPLSTWDSFLAEHQTITVNEGSVVYKTVTLNGITSQVIDTANANTYPGTLVRISFTGDNIVNGDTYYLRVNSDNGFIYADDLVTTTANPPFSEPSGITPINQANGSFVANLDSTTKTQTITIRIRTDQFTEADETFTVSIYARNPDRLIPVPTLITSTYIGYTTVAPIPLCTTNAILVKDTSLTTNLSALQIAGTSSDYAYNTYGKNTTKVLVTITGGRGGDNGGGSSSQGAGRSGDTIRGIIPWSAGDKITVVAGANGAKGSPAGSWGLSTPGEGGSASYVVLTRKDGTSKIVMIAGGGGGGGTGWADSSYNTATVIGGIQASADSPSLVATPTPGGGGGSGGRLGGGGGGGGLTAGAKGRWGAWKDKNDGRHGAGCGQDGTSWYSTDSSVLTSAAYLPGQLATYAAGVTNSSAVRAVILFSPNL